MAAGRYKVSTLKSLIFSLFSIILERNSLGTRALVDTRRELNKVELFLFFFRPGPVGTSFPLASWLQLRGVC